MSNMVTENGINKACNADQWVIVYSETEGLLMAQSISSNQETKTKHTMEVFDDFTVMANRIEELGYEMPEDM